MTLKSEQLDDRDIPDKTCRYCKWWGGSDLVGYASCAKNNTAEEVVCDNCLSPSEDFGKSGLTFYKNFGCIHHEFKETP